MNLNIYYDPIISINKESRCRYCYKINNMKIVRHNLNLSTSNKVTKELSVPKCSLCGKFQFDITLQLYALRLYREKCL